MRQNLTIIGNPNTNQLIQQGVSQLDSRLKGKTITVGGETFTYDAISQMGQKIAADAQPGSNVTGKDMIKMGLQATVDSQIPGASAFLPLDKMADNMAFIYGVDAAKPLSKYNLGDVTYILEGFLTGRSWVNSFKQIGTMLGLAPPQNIKDKNFVNQYGPHLYVPTKFNKPLVGEVGNFPAWFTGGAVTPLNSPALALLELNANLVPQDGSWEWVISHSFVETIPEAEAAYNAGNMFKRAVPYGDAGNLDTWFTFMAIPKNSPDYGRVYKPKTDYWMNWLPNLNAQPNPVLTNPGDWYTFTPEVQPGPLWLRLVAAKNPTYYKKYVDDMAPDFAANLKKAMQKYGIDPLTGRTTAPPVVRPATPPRPPAPPAPPRPVPAAAPKETSNAIPLMAGAGLLFYFLTKR